MAKRTPKSDFVYELKIVHHRGFAELLSVVLAGDGDLDAQRCAMAAVSWLSRYWSARDQSDCFTCGHQLVRSPDAIVLLMPVRRVGRQAIAGGLCSSCCALPGADLTGGIMATVTQAMPSARLRVVPAHGGRA